MGAEHFYRVYYVSNAATGDYFVLCDSMEEYIHRVGAYVSNLHNSQKLNYYVIGSTEMTEAQYYKARAEAGMLESERIQETETQEEKTQEPIAQETKKEYTDNVIQLFGE